MVKSSKFQLTETDVAILKKLTWYYLTPRLLFELLPTFEKCSIKSLRSLQMRLRTLYQQGLINRDHRFSRSQGTNEYYYFLTKQGASFFEELEDTKPGKGILKRLEMGSQEHAFMIAELMVKLEQDIYRSQGKVKLSGYIRENHFDIRIPAQKKDQKNVVYKPDGTVFIQNSKGKQLLFLEADLSTEPVLPVNPLRSSFRRKIIVYTAYRNYFKHDELIRLFGSFDSYRVLMVCQTKERVASLIKAARQMGKKTLFWLSDLKKIKKYNVLFDKIWQLPNGEIRSIL